jgi:hypothetical protein
MRMAGSAWQKYWLQSCTDFQLCFELYPNFCLPASLRKGKSFDQAHRYQVHSDQTHLRSHFLVETIVTCSSSAQINLDFCLGYFNLIQNGLVLLKCFTAFPKLLMRRLLASHSSLREALQNPRQIPLNSWLFLEQQRSLQLNMILRFHPHPLRRTRSQ